jgi:hypothetical protein
VENWKTDFSFSAYSGICEKQTANPFTLVMKQYESGFCTISQNNVRKTVRLKEVRFFMLFRLCSKRFYLTPPCYNPRRANGAN